MSELGGVKLRSLEDLLSELPEVGALNHGPVKVTGVTCDSREVKPGMIFVAVDGSRADGTKFIGDAIARGASVVVSGDAQFDHAGCVHLPVADPRRTLSSLAAAWNEHPSRTLKCVGVTGTNGKTSVCFLIRHILRWHEVRCGLIGTVRYEVGDRILPASRTTPDAVQTQGLLRNMVEAGCQRAVMEVSSHALEQHRVADVSFQSAAFTNLTRDHLDYHGDSESYYLAKRRLFEILSDTSGTAIVNDDDAYGRQLVKDLPELTAKTFSVRSSPTADYAALNIVPTPAGKRFELLTEGERWPVTLPLIGDHNIQNALAAIGLVRTMGYEMSGALEALQTMPGIPGRLERVDCGQPFAVFVDYAHTADALRRVLDTLKSQSPRRLLLLFGCGGDRDEGKRSEMGRIADELTDRFWLTNDNPRHEDPGDIVNHILEGVDRKRTGKWEIEYDRRQAIAGVLGEAEPGDTVLIAGKGHETSQEIDGAIIPFDDRRYVEENLNGLGYDSGAAQSIS